MRDNGWSSVVVTSAEKGAGKSVTAINLAISVARESNQTAYLIDLDLRKSSLHTYLGVEPPAGNLTAYLEGRCGLHDVLVDAGIPRLYFAFNSVPQQHSAELLSSQRMREFVDELQKKDPNGLIIYDAPPLLVADDVLAFLPNFDAVLLVVAEGQTSREDLNKCIDMLSEVEVLGLVLNKSHRAIRKSTYY
jgi:capsular exopolysaccharide synthesis family protein